MWATGGPMDIAEIAARTRLPARRLRYVLDHAVVHAGQWPGEGRGVRRTFTRYEAFKIALAAVMLQCGLTRALARACLRAAAAPPARLTPDEAESPLEEAFLAPKAWMEVGDGDRLRLFGDDARGEDGAFDTGWRF